MDKSLTKLIDGYQTFRKKYHDHDNSIMMPLAEHGQKPKIMVVACCDSRVDPALLLQCDPGDLFVVRNVANIIPPYESDEYHHGTSAALEFAVFYLKIKHLIILGHSQCGGLEASLNKSNLVQDDFITHWVSLTSSKFEDITDVDSCAKSSINNSYQNCLTFPWIKQKLEEKKLTIHRWFFDIQQAQITAYCDENADYRRLQDVLSL